MCAILGPAHVGAGKTSWRNLCWEQLEHPLHLPMPDPIHGGASSEPRPTALPRGFSRRSPSCRPRAVGNAHGQSMGGMETQGSVRPLRLLLPPGSWDSLCLSTASFQEKETPNLAARVEKLDGGRGNSFGLMERLSLWGAAVFCA